jgi:hypothetical protein
VKNRHYKVARNLLKYFAIECIEEEAPGRNLSPSIRKKVQAKALLKISKQTQNFATPVQDKVWKKMIG